MRLRRSGGGINPEKLVSDGLSLSETSFSGNSPSPILGEGRVWGQDIGWITPKD
jgi:hypothetical protein